MNPDQLLRLFIDEVDVERIRAHTDAIHQLDRWSSYDRYHQTADYLLDLMRQNKLTGVRKITTPADGKTIVGDWLMPVAWDAASGTVTVSEPAAHAGRVLADYQACPNHLVRWSVPTSPGGVTAEVVDIGDGGKPESYRDTDVRGKIVLTNGWVHEAKPLAIEHGALGVLTDRTPVAHPDNRHAVPWHNMFSARQHWGPAADEPGLWAFTLTPETGAWLRNAIAASHAPVQLHVEVDARLYEGSIDTVTGRLRGTDRAHEEVWVYSHVYECGADDNASGAALTQEVLAVLRRLVRQGRLPAPRRSIRHIAGWEWIGSTIYLNARRRDLGDVVAAVCLDGVGLPRPMSGRPVHLGINPHVQSSYTDALLVDLWDRYNRLRPSTIIRAHEAPFMRGTDTYFCDPVYDIPHVFPYATIGRMWHNDLDVAAVHDPEMYRVFAATTGAFLYLVASAGPGDVCRLGDIAYGRAIEALARQVRDGGMPDANITLDAIDYSADRHRQAIRSAGRLAPRSGRARRHIADLVKRLDRWVGGEKRALPRRVPASLPARTPDPARTPPRSMRDLGWPQPQRDLLLFPELIPSRGAQVLDTPFFLARMPSDQAKRDRPLVGRYLHALYWMDGRRDLAEIDRLVTHETGRPIGGDIIGLLRRLARYGYVNLRWKHPLTRRRIVAEMRRMGVRRGDCIFLHCSLRSLGEVVGGPETVIDALLDAVGPTGTVTMPTFTFSAASTRDRYPPYHPGRTAARVGAIADAFWRRPNARRSASASHCCAAIGPQADFFSEGAVTVEPYCREGPFGKLYQLDAKVFLVGCGLAPNSSLHAVEDWADLPSVAPIEHLIERDDGTVAPIVYHSGPMGPRDFYRSSAMVTKSEVLLRQHGVLHDGRIGPAVVYWFRFRDMMDSCMQIIANEDPCFLYRDDPDDSDPELSRYFREETVRRLKAGELRLEAAL